MKAILARRAVKKIEREQWRNAFSYWAESGQVEHHRFSWVNKLFKNNFWYGYLIGFLCALILAYLIACVE